MSTQDINRQCKYIMAYRTHIEHVIGRVVDEVELAQRWAERLAEMYRVRHPY